jgi:aspartyl-tRNA(Asn)/glutamyl-tRNA(Gln) amidotransferase subunit A
VADSAELSFLSACELLGLYERGDLSPVEATEAVLARIDELNPQLNAIVTPTPGLAREQAETAERAHRDDRECSPPLSGVPFTIKDTIVTKGVRTTMGSLLLEDWVPTVDAPSAERARAAGGALLGKTNTSEFGWKAATDNRVFGPTLNPWDLTLSPGGSSGGAAAAVATGMGAIALGTDAAGSARIPAAMCGIFGLKPSFGLIPVAPAGPIESLGHVGILTRSVEDAALMLDVVAGPDPRDRLSLPGLGVGFRDSLAKELGGLRIAWSPDLGFARVDPEVAELAAAAAQTFASLGCVVEDAALTLEDPYDAAYLLLAAGSAGGHRDDFDQVRDRLDPARVAMLEHGFRHSAADVGAATAQRARFCEALHQALAPYDLLLTPAAPVAGFAAYLHGPQHVDGEPLDGLRWTALSYGFNLSGQPAASVPCGVTAAGLPVGLQIVGRPRDDALVLRAAAAFETLRPWRQRRPIPLSKENGSVV